MDFLAQSIRRHYRRSMAILRGKCPDCLGSGRGSLANRCKLCFGTGSNDPQTSDYPLDKVKTYQEYGQGARRIFDIVCGYSSASRKKKLLVVLQAYIDESSSREGRRYLVLAGYCMGAEGWINLSEDWEKVLKSDPKIAFFKMSDAHNLSGEFSGWEKGRAVEKIENLIQVIEKYKPASFEVCVSVNAFNKLIKPLNLPELNTPYSLCYCAIMIALMSFHKTVAQSTVPIDFIFDEQEGHGALPTKTYYGIRDAYPQFSAMLGSTPIYRNDRETMPLQAADLLAWHLRRRRQEKFAHEVEAAVSRIIGHPPLFSEYTEENMEDLVKLVNAL